jgi:hypothetical protein
MKRRLGDFDLEWVRDHDRPGVGDQARPDRPDVKGCLDDHLVVRPEASSEVLDRLRVCPALPRPFAEPARGVLDSGHLVTRRMTAGPGGGTKRRRLPVLKREAQGREDGEVRYASTNLASVGRLVPPGDRL